MCDGGGGGALIYAATSGGLADCLRGLLYGFVGTIEAVTTGALVKNYINSSSRTKTQDKTKAVPVPIVKSKNNSQVIGKLTTIK
ncbi:MAG: hypothetical protein WCR27_09695 [Eubacteriales bacterium]